MSKWITKHSVPILDEHVLRDEDGKELVKIDAKKLQVIADRNNQRVAETGDLVPLVIGHTKDNAPEDQQPQIVGYAYNFKVRPFRRTKRKAVTASFKFFKDLIHKAKNYPRRSVELWLSDWKLDPIALLGATTPERDLGLLQLSRHGGPIRKIRRIISPHRYAQMPFPPGSPQTTPLQQAGSSPQSQGQNGTGSTESIVQAVVQALQQTDVWQFLEQQMQDAAQMAVDPGMGGGMDDMGGMPQDMGGMDPNQPPPGEPDFDYSGGDDTTDDDEEDIEGNDEDPERYSAGYSSGTSTFTPSGSGDRAGYPGSMRRHMQRQPVQGRAPAPRNGAPQAPRHVRFQAQDPRVDVIQERVRLAADQERGMRARYARAFNELARENDELRIRFQRTERERDLIQLESEGYIFDRVEELDDVTDMSDEQYSRHLNKIRHRYQRAPIGAASFSSEALRSNSPQPRSRERSLEIATYARQKGLSYAAAVEELEGE